MAMIDTGFGPLMPSGGFEAENLASQGLLGQAAATTPAPAPAASAFAPAAAPAAEPAAAPAAAPASPYASVNDLYSGILGRAGEQAGVDWWSQKFGDTIDANEVKEFTAAARPELAGNIAQLYRDNFGRDADTAGLKYWQDRVNSGDASVDSMAELAANFSGGARGYDVAAAADNAQYPTAWNSGLSADDSRLVYNAAKDRWEIPPKRPEQAPMPVQPNYPANLNQQVDYKTMTIEGRINNILATDAYGNYTNPVIQQAAMRARQSFAARGLLNSSMAEQAALEAATAKAIEIAGPDAQTYFSQSRANQDAQNVFARDEQNFYYDKDKMATQHGYDLEKMAVSNGYDLGKMDKQQVIDMAKMDKAQGFDLEKMAQAFGYDLEKMDKAQVLDLAKMATQQGYTQSNMDKTQGFDLAKMAQANGYDLEKMKQAFGYDMQKLAQAFAYDTQKADQQNSFTATQNALDRQNRLDAAGLQIQANKDSAAQANTWQTQRDANQAVNSAYDTFLRTVDVVLRDTNLTTTEAKLAALKTHANNFNALAQSLGSTMRAPEFSEKSITGSDAPAPAPAPAPPPFSG